MSKQAASLLSVKVTGPGGKVISDGTPGGFLATIKHIKEYAIDYAEDKLKKDQADGRIPADSAEYSFLLKNRGRETKRVWEGIRNSLPWLRIGTSNSPLTFTFIPQTIGTRFVGAAIKTAGAILTSRIGIITRKGNLLNSVMYARAPTIKPNKSARQAGAVNAVVMSTNIDALMRGFGLGESIYIIYNPKNQSGGVYASALEYGFYSGYYQTQKWARKGIMYTIAEQVRRMYAGKVACRFTYVFLGGGTCPAIQISVIGSFSNKDTLPGRTSGKRKRKGESIRDRLRTRKAIGRGRRKGRRMRKRR